MNIRTLTRRTTWIAVTIAGLMTVPAWLAATPPPPEGPSFTELQDPFTQALFATSATVPPDGFSILGGVAFAPDGRVWSSECNFLGTRLHRFAAGTTPTNGSNVHQEELVVDLTMAGPLGYDAGGCGLVNHPDGTMYSNSIAGIWQLNAMTGTVMAGPFGHGGNALGIAVDPQTSHIVYVGDDCHPSLDMSSEQCTVWDLDPVSHQSQVFARLSRTTFMFFDGIYFDPSGSFLFAAHREQSLDPILGLVKTNALHIIRRPAALGSASAPVDDTQSLPLVQMQSEPDGVAFHATNGFLVTLNESSDCVNTTTGQLFAIDPNTGSCAVGLTPAGGSMTRFDFANGYDHAPSAVSTFAVGGFRGDLLQVGPDGCIYGTQAPFNAVVGGFGTRYDSGLQTAEQSIFQICGGFAAPPGVSTTGTLAGTVFSDCSGNGVQDDGDLGAAGISVTVTGPGGSHTTTTDSNGAYTVSGLAPGLYAVHVTAPSGTVVTQPASVTLGANETMSVAPVALIPLSTVSGTVTTTSSQPVSGVTVTVSGTSNQNQAVTTEAITNGSGTFSVTVPPGTYTVTVPGTYNGMTLQSSPATVTTQCGETPPTVTISYDDSGTVRIEKVSIGGTGTFGFSDTVPGGPTSIMTTTAGTPEGVTVSHVAPGHYTVTETGLPSGWTFTSLACTGDGGNTTINGQTANLVVDPGEHIVCTFTNTKQASVTIRKISVGGVGAFNFTNTVPGGATSLTTTAPGVAASATASQVAPGNYAVTETGLPSGWTFTSLACMGDGGNSTINGQTANLVVDPGEDIVCTFTNTKQASVTIRKVSVGGYGTFNFTNTVPGGAASLTTTAPGVAASATASQVAPGNYAVSETGLPSGWTFTGLACTGDGGNSTINGQTANLVVDPGEDIVCTFTNTKQASVTIQKVSVGGVGTFNFTDTVPGGPTSITTVTAGTAAGTTVSGVAQGSYTVTETMLPSGWTFTSLSCSGGGSNTTYSGQTATIGVDPGEAIVCTFTNTKQASVTIRKISLGGYGTFNFTNGVPGGAASLTTTAPGVAASATASQVAPGNYAVTETGLPSGWTFTSLACTGDGGNTTINGQTANLVVDAGEDIVCTFTNTKQASVTIQKVSVGGVGTFNFTDTVPGGPTSITTVTAGTAAGTTVSGVAQGSYTVTETALPAGWNFASLSCSGGGANTTYSGQTATIGVDPGEAIVCTFTNTKQASVTIQKVSVGGVGTFNFTDTVPGGPTSITTTTAGTAAGTTVSSVAQGSYTVTETALPAGWNFTSLSCSGGGANTTYSGQTATIGVDPGEAIVCTFTNTKQASVTIQKVSVGGVGAFSFTDTVPGGPTSITTTTAGTAAGTTVSNVAPGTYTVTETGMPSGWSFTSVSCTGGGTNTTTSGQTASIGVDPGETVVCTFTNSKNSGTGGVCVAPAYTFAFSGNSATSGTAGNIRTFTVNGAAVKASAFSRIDSSGSWSTAYLGLYSAGLGVTDGSEGDGSNERHKVDNIGGRNNYVLFEFDQMVTINRAFLDYIGADSDISVWIGTKTNPYTSHNTLSDTFLAGLGSREDNTTALTATSRWADINATGVSGNVLVISALVNDDTPEDEFKISKIETGCPTPITQCVGSGGDFSFVGNTASSGTAGNIRTFTLNGISVKASGFSRSDAGSWATGYLGLYGSGMGVTDTSEGDGSNNRHKIDNIGGRNNYVLFEFSQTVIIDKAFLDAIGADSDFTVWVGSKTDPFNNHQTLSDAFLSGLGYTEDNTTTATVTSRWGDFNSGRRVGNILVVAALPSDTSPEDEFKISKLTYVCQ